MQAAKYSRGRNGSRFLTDCNHNDRQRLRHELLGRLDGAGLLVKVGVHQVHTAQQDLFPFVLVFLQVSQLALLGRDLQENTRLTHHQMSRTNDRKDFYTDNPFY